MRSRLGDLLGRSASAEPGAYGVAWVGFRYRHTKDSHFHVGEPGQYPLQPPPVLKPDKRFGFPALSDANSLGSAAGLAGHDQILMKIPPDATATGFSTAEPSAHDTGLQKIPQRLGLFHKPRGLGPGDLLSFGLFLHLPISLIPYRQKATKK
jgi:hypothetical protein